MSYISYKNMFCEMLTLGKSGFSKIIFRILCEHKLTYLQKFSQIW